MKKKNQTPGLLHIEKSIITQLTPEEMRMVNGGGDVTNPTKTSGEVDCTRTRPTAPDPTDTTGGGGTQTTVPVPND